MLVSKALSRATERRYKTELLYGVEIEVENAPAPPESAGFDVVGDGSLRNDGAEYVFSRPLKYSLASSALEQWSEMAQQYDFDHNYRTSTHIHANVAHLTTDQLLGLFCMYYVVEPLLFDPDRWQSPYCIPCTETSGFLGSVLHLATRDEGRHLYELGGDRHKYMALGLCRLNDLGTFEFRMFNSSSDYKFLQQRLDMVHTMVSIAGDSFAKGFNTDELATCVTEWIASNNKQSEYASVLVDKFMGDITLTLAEMEAPRKRGKLSLGGTRRGNRTEPEPVRRWHRHGRRAVRRPDDPHIDDMERARRMLDELARDAAGPAQLIDPMGDPVPIPDEDQV